MVVPARSPAFVRNLSAISLNRAVQVAGSLAFVALIPRTLGADAYGHLAFAVALILLLQMAGELGHQEVLSRFVPEAQTRGEAEVRRLFGGLLVFKVFVALAAGLAAGLVSRALADWLTLEQAALVSAAVALRLLTWMPFHLLLGLGHAGRWSVESTWRQVLLVPLILLVALAGPGPALSGALLAFVAHEALFGALALVWTRKYFSWEAVRSVRFEYLAPYLRFGLGFFFANLAVVALFRLGPVLLGAVSGDARQVGYYDLALGAYLLLYTLLGQVSYSLVPPLTQLRLAGRSAEAEEWLRRFARYATMICVTAAGGLWLVAGRLTPLIFGPEFGPVAAVLRIVGLGWLPLGLVWAGVTWSAVTRRPAAKLVATATGLAAFAALGLSLAGSRGALGAAAAFVAGMVAFALAFAPLIAAPLRPAARGLSGALAAGLVFLPLAAFESTLPEALMLGLIGAGVYAAVLVVTQTLPRSEAGRIWYALRGLRLSRL